MQEEKSVKIRLECKACHIPNDYEVEKVEWTIDSPSYAYYNCPNCSNQVMRGDYVYFFEALETAGERIEAINPEKKTTDWKLTSAVLVLLTSGIGIWYLTINLYLPFVLSIANSEAGVQIYLFGILSGFVFSLMFFRKGRFRW